NIGLRGGYWLDVKDFQQLTKNERSGENLIAAADLYREDFLSGFTLPDCPEFDAWQFFQTESLRQALATALDRLIDRLSERTDYETAVSHARRRLALDPLHEPAHRQLMRLFAQSGQQAAALRLYDLCRRTLADELGLEPADETTALYREIQAREVAGEVTQRRRRQNLPTQTTTFVGRENELDEIKTLLLKERNCRLLSLVGPGGIGKTRLALAAAGQMLDAFPDGVFFVSLGSVGETAFIVQAVAAALSLTFYGGTDPQEQLLDYLRKKDLLLVIDNMEHLLEGMTLLSDILGCAPYVRMLTTSRERLHLQEEWIFEVRGLSFPLEENDSSQIWQSSQLPDRYSAIALFDQRARQQAPNFKPTAAEMAEVGRICRLVGGMPLALELAAPWTRTLSCREIATEISRGLDILTATARNVPRRHRSMRVVFEQTWGRLSKEEQAVMKKLSVFRGGYTRKAAEQVAGANLTLLSSLVDKALLRRSNIGRYELHELIRQFAEDQLETDPLEAEQARQRHQEYIVTFLQERTTGIKGARQIEIINEIAIDMPNVRLAWRRIIANRDAAAIDRAAECLFVYYSYSSGHYEGNELFGQAVAMLTSDPAFAAQDVQGDNPLVLKQQENLVGFLLAGQSYFLASTTGGQVMPQGTISRLLQAKPGDRGKEAIGLAFLSYALIYQGRSADGRRFAEQSLALSTEIEEPLGQWWSLIAIANPEVHGRPAFAEKNLMQALSVSEESGDTSARGYSHLNLGRVCVELGKYRQAAQHFEQVWAIFEGLDNIRALGYNFEDVGRLKTALGDYDAAISDFHEALALYRETRTALHAAHCRVWLSVALRLQGDLYQSEQMTRETLATFKAMDDPIHLGYCQLNLGRLAQERGNLAEAERWLKEALQTWGAAGHGARVADVSRSLGHLLAAMGRERHDEARQYLRQGLQLAVKHQITPMILDIFVGAAKLVAQEGEAAYAVELLSIAKNHEASTFETRETARAKKERWTIQLPAEQAIEMQVPGQSQDPYLAANGLLNVLAVDDGVGSI
ncbi:MAG: BTAD domain-containing putative transcriptional regulator, partial [Candidatus Promineifilaceae bacterium]|nr:BTAD domain-containing putative transcriptional regulator [Candidatus Promineifilaceae bacterium]